jgi:hypothetical protein
MTGSASRFHRSVGMSHFRQNGRISRRAAISLMAVGGALEAIMGWAQPARSLTVTTYATPQERQIRLSGYC